MNASASRVEYRSSDALKKSSTKSIIPPPSTTVASLKSDTPRPVSEKNGVSKVKVHDKRKSNGHPPPKPGTSAEASRVPNKRRKIDTPQKPSCPMDLILDEMNNLESQKRKAKKKEDSDSESAKGLLKASTPLPGGFKPPTYLDLLRIETDNSMVFEFLNKRVPSVCEMVLAYKMLRGRVDNFNLTYYERTRVKNIQSHIPPDDELLRQLQGPSFYSNERQKGPRTPSGSPPSPTPPPEEKTEPQYPAGFVPDEDQSPEAQERRKNEVKKYLAERVNLKEVEGMLNEEHWKIMGALKKELMIAIIDKMVEAATIKNSMIPEGTTSPTGNSARNSVAMDISSASSSINERDKPSTSTANISNPLIQANILSGGSQPYILQRPVYQQSQPKPQQPQSSVQHSTQATGYPPVPALTPQKPFQESPITTSHPMDYPPLQQQQYQQTIPHVQQQTPQQHQLLNESNQQPSSSMAFQTPPIRYPPPSNFAANVTPNLTPRLPAPVRLPSRPAFNNNIPAEANFQKPNKRGGMKMNKSQKRFQEFNARPKAPLDPKFTNIDMNVIRNRPPPPIPKMVLEENKKLNENSTSFTAPSIIPQSTPPSDIRPVRPPNVLQSTPPRPIPPPTRVPTPIPRPEMRPAFPRGSMPPPPFREPMPPPNRMPPPPRFRGPPPRPMNPTMQNPPLQQPIATPDSVMSTLFSALKPTTTTGPPPPSMQMQQRPPPMQMQQRLPPPGFRPPFNQSFIRRFPSPMPPPRPQQPRFRPRR